jgi:hypothetical protein
MSPSAEERLSAIETENTPPNNSKGKFNVSDFLPATKANSPY